LGEDYTLYAANMARSCTWGDELTLVSPLKKGLVGRNQARQLGFLAGWGMED
jgi:hypothetical protein